VTITVTDLGTLPGGVLSFAYDINNQGVIVGQGTDPTRYELPIVWRNLVPTSLPTLGGQSGRAYALNDVGDMVGTTWDPSGFNTATLWRGGGPPTSLGALPIAASPRSHGMAINRWGDIVGASNELVAPTTGVLSLVRWPAGGAMTNLGPIADYLLAAYFPKPQGMNDSGVVVGTRGGTGAPVLVYPPRAFSWRSGVFTDLISLGGSLAGTAANAINNAGVIAGSSRTGVGTTGYLHAVIWKQGQPTDLGVLPGGGNESVAYAIADNGDVAGYSIAANYQPHAVLWRGGQIIDLGVSPGGLSSHAWGINENGQVVGEGVINTTTFDTHALLWTIQSGGVNQPPVANFTWSCTAARACSFDGTSSTDDHGIVGWAWTVNGKVVATTPVFSRQFPGSRTFNLTLKVTDGGGLSSSLTRTIVVQ
jgi:probable HAF family extracellular repeat protein